MLYLSQLKLSHLGEINIYSHRNPIGTVHFHKLPLIRIFHQQNYFGESISMGVESRCPDGTQFFSYRPMLATSGRLLTLDDPIVNTFHHQ